MATNTPAATTNKITAMIVLDDSLSLPALEFESAEAAVGFGVAGSSSEGYRVGRGVGALGAGVATYGTQLRELHAWAALAPQ